MTHPTAARAVFQDVLKGEQRLLIEMEITRDEVFLGQYYALREKCFRAELGIPQFDGSEEERDRSGYVLVAHSDNRCLAGVRISPDLLLPSLAQSLTIDQSRCCMWERFVVDPSVRKLPLIREFIGSLVQHSRELGYDHAMVLSSLCNARFYRRCLRSLGVEYAIQRQVPHCADGSFAGLEHYLSVAHLQQTRPLSLVM